jgi:hypothetical protein
MAGLLDTPLTAKYISSIGFWDGIIHKREMRNEVAIRTSGYIYAARCSLIPNVVKIGVCWDTNLNIRQLQDEKQKEQIAKNGQRMVTERLGWLASQSQLPGTFEIIAGFATRNPYKTKWRMHDYFSRFRLSSNIWPEFFIMEDKVVCDKFAMAVTSGNLPCFSLAAVKLPAVVSNKGTFTLSSLQSSKTVAWDIPLIPKLLALNQDLSSNEDLSPNSNQDLSSNEDLSQSSSQEESPTVQKKKTRNARRCNGRGRLHEGQPGLFIAEMNCGVHISLGPCWATKHYDNQQKDAHPLIVIHMVIPSRGEPFL